jgi:hypothetical protein
MWSIDFDAVPAAERTAAEHVGRSLNALNLYLDEFASALQLFDFVSGLLNRLPFPPPSEEAEQKILARNAKRFVGWRELAARDGATTVYHIGCAIAAVRTKTLPLCPTLNALTDHPALRAAERQFHRAFPNTDMIRHAVGHAAEILATPEKAAENAFSGTHSEPDGVTVTGEAVGLVSLTGRRYSVTIKKQIVSYELSYESFTSLVECVRAFRTALPLAEDGTQRSDDIERAIDQEIANPASNQR